MSADVEYEKVSVGSTGERFRVWHDGQQIVKSSKSPLCDAARALSASGVTGRIRMKPVGAKRWHIEGLIVVLANLTVSETKDHGPRFIKYKPHFAAGAV